MYCSRHSCTYPGGKVQLGFKVRSDLHIFPGRGMVTEVSLHGVTCQLEVHLLLLTTLRVKHPFPHIRVVEIPCLSFTGTIKHKGKKERDVHKKISERRTTMDVEWNSYRTYKGGHTKGVCHFLCSTALWGRALEAAVSSVVPLCRKRQVRNIVCVSIFCHAKWNVLACRPLNCASQLTDKLVWWGHSLMLLIYFI